ncbi:HlyD family secretion protein [Nitrospirillum sp. BR 11828]|uniref:HlyD family secretion protein n=1 Tax=Nitrospirillum sp. BR 11828 TaxID=3104325 RepID=UPI002ACAC1BC|nr:HlyD family secretion protein [Nitrospirillum sp. BR 11828]MDZ5648743.1 HlyD family secretion protein [Nitrospirillum sp. BR 11828]
MNARLAPLLRALGRGGATLAMVGVAVLLIAALWQRYMLAPWTRDGRVRAEVVDVAPEVAGTIVDIPVHDNQLVRKGDVLFVIDPVRFRIAQAQARAAVAAARDERALKLSDAQRRQGLAGVVSDAEQERFRSTASVANAQLEAAEAALDLANLNLERSVIRAPVNGYVTNLRLRVGDYATTGQPRVAVIDTDSFWVSGYFEETKLARIHEGDTARIKLMGYTPPLTGHVETIARGINDRNSAPNAYGLQDVNPVFTWVRLAQRIPVRVGIDTVPPGVVLAAGMTCTVSVGDEAQRPQGLVGRVLARLESRI